MAHAKEKIIGTKDPLTEAAEHFAKLGRTKREKAQKPITDERAALRAELLPERDKLRQALAAERADKPYKLTQLRLGLESTFPPGFPQPRQVEDVLLWIEQYLNLAMSTERTLDELPADIAKGKARHLLDKDLENCENCIGTLRDLYRTIETNTSQLMGSPATKELEGAHA